MTTFPAAHTISIRPLALPSEHGAWGLMLEPIVLAMIVAPSLAGLFVAIGAVALFLMRHPLKLGAIDGLKHRRYPRTALCELLVIGYGLAASLAFATAWTLGGVKPLMLLMTALPFAAVQFTYDVTSRGRRAAAEITAAIVPAFFAAAIASPAGTRLALTLAVLTLCRAIPSVLYVRSILRESGRDAMIAAHVVAMVVAGIVAPLMTMLAFGALLVRAAIPTSAPAKVIGMREVGWGAFAVLVIAISLTGSVPSSFFF